MKNHYEQYKSIAFRNTVQKSKSSNNEKHKMEFLHVQCPNCCNTVAPVAEISDKELVCKYCYLKFRLDIKVWGQIIKPPSSKVDVLQLPLCGATIYHTKSGDIDGNAQVTTIELEGESQFPFTEFEKTDKGFKLQFVGTWEAGEFLAAMSILHKKYHNRFGAEEVS